MSAAVSRLFKRPESVLVVVYTVDLDVLLICRREPAHFWQSVTGSLELDETAPEAAQRELLEETGISSPHIVDHARSRVFAIKPAWRKRYAPGVVENREYEFSVQLPQRCPVTLDAAEHVDYQWLPMAEAISTVSSYTNRAALRAIWETER